MSTPPPSSADILSTYQRLSNRSSTPKSAHETSQSLNYSPGISLSTGSVPQKMDFSVVMNKYQSPSRLRQKTSGKPRKKPSHNAVSTPTKSRKSQKQPVITNNPTPEEREAALALLQKSQRLNQRKLHRKLKERINEEIRLMKMESQKRRRVRLRELQQRELKIEEQYNEWIHNLEHVSKRVMQKKCSLVQKLCELETRQKIDTLLREQRSDRSKNITHEQVKVLAHEEQRKQLARIAIKARRHLQGQFVATLEEFSSIDRQQERKDIQQNIEKYVQPVLQRRKKLSLKQRAQSEKLMDETVQKIINGEKRRVEEEANARLIENHRNKCVALEEVSKHIHLSRRELDDILKLDVINYETDIGIADAEMEALRKRIDTLQRETFETVEAFNEVIQKEKDTSENLNREIDEKRTPYEALRQRLTDLQEEEAQLVKQARRDTETMYKKSIATCIKASENTKKHIAGLTEETNAVVERQRILHQEQQSSVSALNAIKLSHDAVRSEAEQTLDEIKLIEDNSRELQKTLEDYQYKASHSSEVLKDRRKHLIEERNKCIASQVMSRQMEQTLDLSCELIRTENSNMIPRASLYGLRSYLRELNSQYKESTQLLLDYLCYLKVIDAGISSEDKSTILLDESDNRTHESQDAAAISTVSLYEAEDLHLENTNREDGDSAIPELKHILKRGLNASEMSMRSEFTRYMICQWINIQKVGLKHWTFEEVQQHMSSDQSSSLENQHSMLQDQLLREYFKQQRYIRYLSKHDCKVSLSKPAAGSTSDCTISSPLVDLPLLLKGKFAQKPSKQDRDITYSISVRESKAEKDRALLLSNVRSILDQIQNFAAGDMSIEQQRIRQKLRRLKDEEKRKEQLEQRRQEIAEKNQALEALTSAEKSRRLNRLPEQANKQSSSTDMLIDQQREKLRAEKKFSPRSLLLLRNRRPSVV